MRGGIPPPPSPSARRPPPLNHHGPPLLPARAKQLPHHTRGGYPPPPQQRAGGVTPSGKIVGGGEVPLPPSPPLQRSGGFRKQEKSGFSGGKSRESQNGTMPDSSDAGTRQGWGGTPTPLPMVVGGVAPSGKNWVGGATKPPPLYGYCHNAAETRAWGVPNDPACVHSFMQGIVRESGNLSGRIPAWIVAGRFFCVLPFRAAGGPHAGIICTGRYLPVHRAL